MFVFQGYVRYLSNLYWELENQKWWEKYRSEWEA